MQRSSLSGPIDGRQQVAVTRASFRKGGFARLLTEQVNFPLTAGWTGTCFLLGSQCPKRGDPVAGWLVPAPVQPLQKGGLAR